MKKGKEYRSSKMPTDEEMMLVAKLFHDAPNLDKETDIIQLLWLYL